jgi:predicted Zn-dependent protease
MIKALEPPDIHHLNAAEGWLGLGSMADAQEELAKLSPAAQAHPDALRVRYHLYERSKQWESAVEIAQQLCQALPETPFGWIHLAYALHELRRTREAYSVLQPNARRFPGEYIIHYNLACYCCQMGELEEARAWLKTAIALAGAEPIKQMALSDPDLETLKEEIQRI